MANRKNEYGVAPLVETVHRQIARLAARNDQFAQPMFSGTANKWMASKQFNGLGDQVDGFGGRHSVDGDQEIGQPRQIGKRSL